MNQQTILRLATLSQINRLRARIRELSFDASDAAARIIAAARRLIDSLRTTLVAVFGAFDELVVFPR